jgi:hypothetical protein
MGILVAITVTGCSSGVTPSPTPQVPAIEIPQQTGLTATAADERGAVRPAPPLTGCTQTATNPDTAHDALVDATPGAKICIIGDLRGWRMKIGYSGTEQAPIQVVGDGQTRVGSIEVEALNVIVDGFNVLNTPSPQVQINSNNVTVRSVVALNPLRPGSDNVQVNGDYITITHNTLGEASGDGGKSSRRGAKANCIDILAEDPGERTSHHVRVENNRCQSTAINCLRAFTPEPGENDARAPTSDVTFTNNYCQTRGTTAVTADNVQGMTITDNEIAPVDHAWALQNNSTGAKISGNKLAPGTRFEVGIDESSQDGYDGPPAGGNP